MRYVKIIRPKWSTRFANVLTDAIRNDPLDYADECFDEWFHNNPVRGWILVTIAAIGVVAALVGASWLVYN